MLELRPENAPNDVEAFLKMMKWQDRADDPFSISAASDGAPVCTLLCCLQALMWTHRSTSSVSLAITDNAAAALDDPSRHL